MRILVIRGMVLKGIMGLAPPHAPGYQCVFFTTGPKAMESNGRGLEPVTL